MKILIVHLTIGNNLLVNKSMNKFFLFNLLINIIYIYRLLIAIGSYIGECIVWYPKISKKFIISNGIYLMLDIIENASLFVRNVYFKSLVDLCTSPEAIPYVCTWRDKNKKNGFMSLLAKCWREEEIKLNVKRTRDGCIEGNK